MPIYTVSWKSEMNNWTVIEADSKDEALEAVLNGLHEDVDCEDSGRPDYGYEVDEGVTGQCSITKINK